MQPRIRSSQPSIRCLIGTRTPHIRGRTAPRRTTSKLCFAAGPDSERIRACLLSVQPPSCASAHDRDRWIAPPATAELFNKLLQDDLGTGRRSVLHLCGCSSAGRARPRHGRGHEFETRHPLHFGCVLSLRCRVTWCWRCGMCATLGQATCSETPHPTGCSRLGTAEVDRQTRGLFASLTQRPECRPRVRLPHEAPDQFAEIAQQVERRVEGACVGGSKPSLGTRHTEPR